MPRAPCSWQTTRTLLCSYILVFLLICTLIGTYQVRDLLLCAGVITLWCAVLYCARGTAVSVYRGSWVMYVVPVIAQHNGMALLRVLLSTWYNVAACVVAL